LSKYDLAIALSPVKAPEENAPAQAVGKPLFGGDPIAGVETIPAIPPAQRGKLLTFHRLGDRAGDSLAKPLTDIHADGVVQYTHRKEREAMTFESFTDDQFAAYVAGFTDGEGCIYLPYKPGYGAARVTVANCVKDILLAIRSRLGYGTIKSQRQNPAWREKFTLDIYSANDVERFLLLVRPFLLIKASQADDALNRIAMQKERYAIRKARNAAIIQAAQNGEMRKVIAARFRVSAQTVSRLCEGHKWPSERKHIAKLRKRDSRGLFVPIQ
jgi:hypothetical protein